MNKVFKYYIVPLSIFAFISFFSCKKDANDIPDVYVDLYLYTTDPAFAPLNATSGYAYVAGGSKGIIIFRKSQTEFMAYDRHCTYKVADGNFVTVDASGLLAEDAACGSKFLITDGSPNQGPALNSLKQYQTAFDGTVLHIFN
jgi:nitrite reductase/ring-hydroxylating ferredoxin subunit